MKRKTYFNIFYAILLIVFLFGGTLQFLGIISNTVLTFLIGFLLVLLNISRKALVTVNKWPYVFTLFAIILSSIINNTELNLVVLYFVSFIAIPYCVQLFIINQYLYSFNLKKVFDFFLFISIIQLPILFIQQTYSLILVSLSSRVLAIEDVAFGTFFFANDHGLCFFILSMLINILFNNVIISSRKRILYIVWLSLTVIVAQSNVSFLLLCLVYIYYFFTRFNLKLLLSGVFLFLLASIVVLVFPDIFTSIESKYEFINRKIFESETSSYESQRKIERGIAERGDILSEFLEKDLSIFGEGPYTYFDPIKGEFPVYRNFSQYLWFYLDIGLIGLLSIPIIYIVLYRQFLKYNEYTILYLFLILVYSFFTNTLSDLSFNIVFVLFLLKESKLFYKTRQDELSMYPIS